MNTTWWTATEDLWRTVRWGLLQHPWQWWAIGAFVGSCLASCVGLVVARYPAWWRYKETQRAWAWLHDQENLPLPSETKVPPDGLWWPPSRCDACGTALKPWHNLPLLGWWWVRGRCATCHTSIPMITWWAEVAGALMGAGVAIAVGITPWAAAWWGAMAWSCALAGVDARTRWLPDRMTVPLGVVGLVVDATASGHAGFPTLGNGLLGGALGWGCVHAATWAKKRWPRATNSLRWPDLGGGDAKAMGAWGVWIGAAHTAWALALTVLMVIVITHVRTPPQEQKTTWPLGPWLLVGIGLSFITLW